MKRYRFGLRTLGFAAALLASTAALAGFRTAQQVVIWDAGRMANGDLGYIHNQPDLTQYMGCYSYATAGGCYATDRTGLTRSCSTSDANQLAVIRSLKTDSYLLFYWDTSGHCMFIEVDNSSATAPKS